MRLSLLVGACASVLLAAPALALGGSSDGGGQWPFPVGEPGFLTASQFLELGGCPGGYGATLFDEPEHDTHHVIICETKNAALQIEYAGGTALVPDYGGFETAVRTAVNGGNLAAIAQFYQDVEKGWAHNVVLTQVTVPGYSWMIASVGYTGEEVCLTEVGGGSADWSSNLEMMVIECHDYGTPIDHLIDQAWLQSRILGLTGTSVRPEDGVFTEEWRAIDTELASIEAALIKAGEDPLYAGAVREMLRIAILSGTGEIVLASEFDPAVAALLVAFVEKHGGLDALKELVGIPTS